MALDDIVTPTRNSLVLEIPQELSFTLDDIVADNDNFELESTGSNIELDYSYIE